MRLHTRVSCWWTTERWTGRSSMTPLICERKSRGCNSNQGSSRRVLRERRILSVSGKRSPSRRTTTSKSYRSKFRMSQKSCNKIVRRMLKLSALLLWAHQRSKALSRKRYRSRISKLRPRPSGLESKIKRMTWTRVIWTLERLDAVILKLASFC